MTATSVGGNLLLLIFLSVPGAVLAEGGCPAGMIPYSGNNLNSCGPIPPGYYGNDGTAAAPPLPAEWASRWGAIATYAPTGVLGTSNGVSSRDIAENLAIADCRNKGGLTCKIEVTYDNKCAAVIVGDEGYVVTSRAYESDAIGAGISVCGGETNHCHALYTACSRPVRIR